MWLALVALVVCLLCCDDACCCCCVGVVLVWCLRFAHPLWEHRTARRQLGRRWLRALQPLPPRHCGWRQPSHSSIPLNCYSSPSKCNKHPLSLSQQTIHNITPLQLVRFLETAEAAAPQEFGYILSLSLSLSSHLHREPSPQISKSIAPSAGSAAGATVPRAGVKGTAPRLLSLSPSLSLSPLLLGP